MRGFVAAALLVSCVFHARAQSVHPDANRAGTGPTRPSDAVTSSGRQAADAAKAGTTSGTLTPPTIQTATGVAVVHLFPSPGIIAGPQVLGFGPGPGTDEHIGLVLQHRGYGHGDSATALQILENSDQAGNFGQGDAGFDNGLGAEAGYTSADTVALYVQNSGATPAAIVQAGEGIQYPFNQPNTPSQTLSFTAKSVAFSPPLPAAIAPNILPRAQIQTNAMGIPGGSAAAANPFLGQITGFATDADGNVTAINVTGWAQAGNSKAGQVPSATATGTPLVVAAGHGYAPGDTVTMNTVSGGQGPTVFTVQMTGDIEGSNPAGPASYVEQAAFRNIGGATPFAAGGRYTQTSTTGRGSGLVLDANPAVFINTNNNVFGQNTVVSLGQGFYNVTPIAGYGVGHEIDVVNDFGETHAYRGGVPTEMPGQHSIIDPTDLKGFDVFSKGNNAISYAYGAGGDMEMGYISSGARQYGFSYTPQGSAAAMFVNSDGFFSSQLSGLAFVHQRSRASAPDFSVSAAGAVYAGGGVIAPLHTPASSHATCTAGQSWDDANYHYVCVATDFIKRVKLSSF